MSLRRIDRYVVASVASSMLLVLSVVLALDLVFAFVGEMDEIEGAYQLSEVIFYVAATIPRRIYDYLPLAAFMGCLVGLGNLAKNSELVVVRAAGVSTGRIMLSAMKPVLVVVIFGLFLGEYVAPYTEKIAQSSRAVAQGAHSSVVSQKGLWHREANVFMHFNAVEPNGLLHGVTLHEYNTDKELVNAKFARRAIYLKGEWMLEDVEQTSFFGGRIETSSLPWLKWDTELSPSVLSVLIVKPDDLSISGLYTYSNYLEDQDLSSEQYEMAFWKKILQPVATAVLVLVAIAFVFGPLRSVTMGFRVFCGLIVGLIFKYMQDLLGPASLVFGFDPILATVVPIGICAVFGVIMLRRAG